MTANGTEISDGESLSGSQVLRVEGSNLTPPYFSLWLNGVEYTPLDYGDGYVEYVLQQNGTYEIRNEAGIVMQFSISGVEVPANLPTRFTMTQRDVNLTGAINTRTVDLGYCMNYPFKRNPDKPVFFLNMGNSNHPFTDIDNFEGHNCVIGSIARDGEYAARFGAAVTSPYEDTAWVTYKGFIIAVFNYTTTP